MTNQMQLSKQAITIHLSMSYQQDQDHIYHEFDHLEDLSVQLEQLYQDDDYMYLPSSTYSLSEEPSFSFDFDQNSNKHSSTGTKVQQKSNNSQSIDNSHENNEDFQHFCNDDMKLGSFDESLQDYQIKNSNQIKLKVLVDQDSYHYHEHKVKIKDSQQSTQSFITNIPPVRPKKVQKRASKICHKRLNKDINPNVYVRAEQYLRLKYTLRQMSEKLGLPLPQIRRLKALFQLKGTLLKTTGQSVSIIETTQKQKEYELVKQILKKLIDKNCSITLKTMQQTIKEHGIIRSRSTIHAYLQRMRYSRKRIQKIPLERNSHNKLIYRQNYCKMMQQIAFDKQIFLDQTIFGLQTSGHYGWAPKGEQPKVFIPASKRKHITLLAAISVKGFQATKIIKGPVTSRHICQFLQHYLDHLQPDEILILDNARMHHAAIVKEKIRELNRPVRYIPAYTPQLNPIENIFSEIKAAYNRLKQEQDVKSQDMTNLVQEAIKNMRSKQFTRYYEHYEQWLRKGAAGELFI